MRKADMSFEQTEPELFQKVALRFVHYYEKLSKEQVSTDEWITGYDIATAWLRLLNMDSPPTDEIDNLLARASELKNSGGSGAIDMHAWLRKWKRWATESHKPQEEL
jgi:hypothetical protein